MSHPTKKGERFKFTLSGEVLTVRQFLATKANGKAFFSDTYEGAIKKGAIKLRVVNEKYGGITFLEKSVKV